MKIIRLLIVAVALALIGTWGLSHVMERFGRPSRQDAVRAGAGQGLSTFEEIRGSEAGLRVLFVGNSFTYYNDLPVMVRDLAKEAGEELPLLAMQETPGGCTLMQHCENGVVNQLLTDAKWDYVVLQEQSPLPSFSRIQQQKDIYPYARQLDALVKAAGARTVLFMTWGRKEGDPSNVPGDSYAAMQERLHRGYLDLATELSATVAPAGLAWKSAWQEKPSLELWDVDGVHPSLQGSYLAACVLYLVLYDRDACDSRYTAGLSTAEAEFLQKIAATVIARESAN